MAYLYKGKRKEAIPNFAALAVLESQRCPNSVIFSLNNYIGQEQICTSRYRNIRVLYAASDTLKKEYIEVKQMPVHPYFKHRPVLIFGKYKNGYIQIEQYEETREYFDDINCNDCIQYQDFHPFLSSDNIYVLHSIGSPYYNLKNLDSLDKIYYNEYLMPYIKQSVETSGKNFNELLLRLIQNRTQIKATKVKNNFVVLGAIKSLRFANDSKRTNFYELNLTIEAIIKNNTKIDSNIAIFIDRENLPSGWGCQPLEHYLKMKTPFYFFGDLKNDSLFINSLISPQDAFVFGDSLYDTSMGLPFEELIAYFFPKNISIEEFKFAKGLERSFNFSSIRNGEIPENMKIMPKCVKDAIIEISTKWSDFFDNQQHEEKIEIKQGEPFIAGLIPFVDNRFRCLKTNDLSWVPHEMSEGCQSDLKNEGVWGRKW